MSRIVMLAFALCVAAILLTSVPAPGAESVKTISVTASEFKFVPATVSLKRGQRVALRITNRGTMDHEFLSTLFKAAKDVEIKAEGVKVEADEVEEVELEKSHTAIIELTPTKAGTFPYWCAEVLKGKLHRDLGMKGVITVKP